jgi:putative transposase
MTKTTTATRLPLFPSLETAWQDVDSSFERFCLTAGIGAIEQMLGEEAEQLTGAPHSRGEGRLGHRWGRTQGKIGFHGGKVEVHRPRVRSFDGREMALPTWAAAQAEDWLGRWATNLMLINVSTRKLRRAVRLPEGDLRAIPGDGTSKSAASRRFVALSAERLAEWMASDLSTLDLLVIQIDGLHIGNDLVLVAALGIDADGHKHPLGLVEGATENATVVQALIDNLIERGLDPKVCRLFIVDGAKALSKVIRRTFGAHTPIQRCQIHKARNVVERLPKPLHAPVRRALRQAWELDDADKAERLLRNLARRLDQEAPSVAASILEGLDEMVTVNRLGLPTPLQRSLACTNSIENMMGTVRRVCRNVKRWRNAALITHPGEVDPENESLQPRKYQPIDAAEGWALGRQRRTKVSSKTAAGAKLLPQCPSGHPLSRTSGPNMCPSFGLIL